MLIKDNKRFTPLSAVLLMLLLAAWAGGYVSLPMYFDMCDESYQIMCGWDYRSSVAAPLSAWLTSVIGPLWNFDYFPFRTMGWTLHIIAVLIGMLPVWWMSRNINFTLGAGAVSIFLFSMCRGIEWMFNWDSYAVPVLMAVVALCVNYRMRPRWWKIAAMGIACGVLATLRLPSSAAIAIPAVCILLTKGRPRFAGIVALMATYAVCALAIILALYGSISEFRAMLDSNLITSHGTSELLELYQGQFPMLYLYGLAAAGAFFLIGRACPAVALATALATAIGFYLFLRAGVDHSNWYFASPLYIVTEAYLVWKSRGLCRFAAIMALMATIFGGLGSNIMIARVVIYPTMPIVLYLVAMNILTRAKAASFAAIWLTMFAISREDVASMFTEQDKSPIQPPPHELRGVPHMKRMFVGWWDIDRIQRVADRFMPFVNDTTYSTAVMRNIPDDFMFEYMFDSRSPIYAHSWDSDTLMQNRDYTDRFTRWIESSERPVAVLMVRYVNTLDGPEEEIIGEYKRRYRTVYTDSTFTIVIKDKKQEK